MSRQDEIFFTTVGCMDGRVQEVVAQFGRKKINYTPVILSRSAGR